MNNINTGEFARKLQDLKDNKRPMEDLLSLYKEYFSVYPEINIVKKYYTMVLGKSFNSSALLKYNKLCNISEIKENPMDDPMFFDNSKDEDYHEEEDYDSDYDDYGDDEDF